MTIMTRYRVREEDWTRFASTYSYQRFEWADGVSLLRFNPFDDYAMGKYIYVDLWDDGDVTYSCDEPISSGVGFSDWKPYSCYFCTGKEVADGIRYLDLDGDLVRAENDDDYQGFESSKAYLFTENKVIEAKFCPVCGERL